MYVKRVVGVCQSQMYQIVSMRSVETPAPGPGEARPGVLVVCGRGGYCWRWRRLQLGWEAGAGAGLVLGHATSSVRLHLILAEPGPRPPARQQLHSPELGTNIHEV